MDKERLMQRIRKLPPVTTALVNINIILFILCAFEGDVLYNKGCVGILLLDNPKEYYRIISAMFLHADISHLASNMIMLFFLGEMLERSMKSFLFAVLYMLTGIMGNLASLWYESFTMDYSFSIGASGAVFGCFGMVAVLAIFRRIPGEKIDLRKMLAAIILSLYSGFSNPDINNAAHVGGLIAGIIMGFLILVFSKSRRTYEN